MFYAFILLSSDATFQQSTLIIYMTRGRFYFVFICKEAMTNILNVAFPVPVGCCVTSPDYISIVLASLPALIVNSLFYRRSVLKRLRWNFKALQCQKAVN